MERKALTRRSFLAKSIIASGGVILSSHLIACANDDDFSEDDGPSDGIPRFLHGVGSFDPTDSAVIIWTRFTPTTDEVTNGVNIKWQVASDAEFNSILKEGEQMATMAGDFTIVENVTGLEADQKLYYRFMQEDLNAVSPIGETITLPGPGASPAAVKMAVCSCSNFPAGLFNVYDAIANSEADVVLHLGDYIYEYGVGQYGTNENTDTLNRAHDPTTEILSLEDYRLRYRQYRTDEGLQLAHQKKPFIVVWDDHEITNDAYQDGAENHNEGEGSFEERKQIAIQVHSEYLPVRTDTPGVIYRDFQFGDLVHLTMLDTRLVARDKQLSFTDYFDQQGNFDITSFGNDIGNPDRAMLGGQQLNWVGGRLGASNAKWEVIGQQVLMGEMTVPAELLTTIGAIAAGNTSPEIIEQLQLQIVELSTLKQRALAEDPTLTPEELARINTKLPYNLDAWDGYPVERSLLLGNFVNKNVVVFAGDTHNAWNNELIDFTATKVGVEFACPSVTSPGFEGLFGTDPTTLAGLEQAFTLLIDGLKYFDASKRGYILAEFTAGAATANYNFIDNIASATYNETLGHTASVNA